ncbi:hypothetical protein KAI92_04725 [Candidatus Parcubacteria bacterium]|nr:hypothetical protein [Candidatus Parcubacteria bacterium]
MKGNLNEKQSSQVPKNIQTTQVFDKENDIIKFVGENYKFYDTESINNGTAFYYSPGNLPSLIEITINVYDNNIKAEDLANNVIEDRKKNGDKLYQPFISSDKNNKDVFYITSLQVNLLDRPDAHIFIMKIFNAEQTYMIIYRKTILGVVSWMLEEEADDWLIKNAEIYGKAIDEINPLSVSVNEK